MGAGRGTWRAPIEEARMSTVSMAAAFFLLLTCSTSLAAAPPDFSGAWKINRGLSDDAEAKVKDAAGSAYVQGAPSWASETVLPWGRKFDENERLSLREVLLGAVEGLATVEVEQTPSEIKTIHGEDAVRVFYLKREGTGSTVLTGETVRRKARWKGEQLVLESEGGKTKVVEVLTLVPSRNQLIHLLHLEMDLLKSPIDLKLVYDRDAAPSPAP
jgi:hypothetical protein